MKNVVFLDYDGVVNTSLWGDYVTEFGETIHKCGYAWPRDGHVNNKNAIEWLNYLYTVINYDIIVISTWAEYDNFEECLRNSGLNENIKILGRTDRVDIRREDSILDYVNKNKCSYVIFDDEKWLYLHDYKDHNLIIVNNETGINRKNIEMAIDSFAKQKVCLENYYK